MTPAERLRWLAGDCQATSAWAADLKAGADALDRAAQTCANCAFVTTEHANEGTGLCQNTGDGIGDWVPLHARCDSWEAQEPPA